MDTSTIVITIVSIIAAKTFALLGLRLRLRWRERSEQAHRQCLLGFAEAVAAGGRMELDDERGDGRRVRMDITCTPAHRIDPAA